MTIIIEIGKFILNIIYFFIKMFPTKRKIAFISRQSNNTSYDFYQIMSNIDNVEKVVITKKLEKNISSFILNCFLLIKQMYHIATSKIVVIDGYCIPISILKHKKQLIVIQLWHAEVVLKKIGLQTTKNKKNFMSKLAKHMNMHKNYTYVIASSKEASKVYQEAFNIKEENVLIFGTPTLDYLYNKEYLNKKEDIIKKYSLNNKKKNILYAPTYRKNENIDISELIDNFDFQKYNLLIKMHPVNMQDVKDKRVISIKKYTCEELLSVADYVISDYSNVAFEAMYVDIPTYLYVYDIDAYIKKQGLNINPLKKFEEISSKDIKVILKNIKDNKYNYKEVKKNINKYIYDFEGKSVENISKFISEKLDQ